MEYNLKPLSKQTIASVVDSLRYEVFKNDECIVDVFAVNDDWGVAIQVDVSKPRFNKRALESVAYWPSLYLNYTVYYKLVPDEPKINNKPEKEERQYDYE